MAHYDLKRTLGLAEKIAAFSICSFLLLSSSYAGTLVQVNTSLGDFYLELDDEAAPETVANFLNYVRSGRFNNTYIHAAQGNTFIRGGSFTFNDCNVGPETIETDAPIAFETTGLSNLSGTIAMRHSDGDVDSATSEWFINIGDDPDSDTFNGGYAVFGKVVSDGLDTVATISNAPGIRLTAVHTAPTTNYFGDEQVDCQSFSRDNLVLVLMTELEEDANRPTADFNSINGLLNVNLDLGGDGISNLDFAVDADADPVTIQPLLDSSVPLTAPVANMATYNSTTGLLEMPSAAVDGAVQYRNLKFVLTDSDTSRFTIISSD